MKIVSMSCPHCGASLQLDADQKNLKCEYCGNSILIDDEVKHIQFDNAEESGYLFEKGRQRAKAESAIEYQQTVPTYTYEKPKKRRTWLWILGWLFIFPVPLTILMVRNQKMNKIVKIAIIVIAWLVYLAIARSGKTVNSNRSRKDLNSTDSSNGDASESNITTSDNEAEVLNEDYSSNDLDDVVEAEDITMPLINFLKAYIDHGTVETIKDLAEEYGVYSNTKNTGTGNYYYKIALTYNDSRVVSLGDLTKGDYCIVINGGGESLTYYNNVDYLEIHYSDVDGFSLTDSSRLEPFENGTFTVSVNSLEEALEYKTEMSSELSPIELLYIEAQVGMSESDFRTLVNQYGLIMKYRRSNSTDGYVSYSGDNIETHIVFDGKGVISDLDYYDYYVQHKYGLHVEYIDEDQSNKRSGDYPEPGYYIVGDDVYEYYATAEEAITNLHAYRLK